MNHAGFGSRRRDATLLFITFVTAVAFGNGVENLRDIPLLSWRAWILPTVYMITLLRFAVGSYTHMLNLEDKNIGNVFWFVDLIIVFVVEMAIIALMAFFFDPGKISIFAALLVALGFVDAGWVVIILCTLPWRPGMGWPWPWFLMNGGSAGIVLVLLLFNYLTGDQGLQFLVSLFAFVALVDVILSLSGLVDKLAWPRKKMTSRCV